MSSCSTSQWNSLSHVRVLVSTFSLLSRGHRTVEPVKRLSREAGQETPEYNAGLSRHPGVLAGGAGSPAAEQAATVGDPVVAAESGRGLKTI